MTVETRSFALDVSEPLFRLATESLRLHANETKRIDSLGGLVDERALDLRVDDCSPEAMRDHLSIVPTAGEIRINFNITKSSVESLAEARQQFERSLGENVSMGDTISILLFQYVAAQKARLVLDRIGLDGTRMDEISAPTAVTSASNVIPFR